MDGWELISIGPEGFEIQMNFTNPVAISTSDEPDLLLIQLDVVESNEVVCGEHEVEVIRYDKAHRLDRLGLGELEAHLFRLLLLQKE